MLNILNYLNAALFPLVVAQSLENRLPGIKVFGVSGNMGRSRNLNLKYVTAVLNVLFFAFLPTRFI